MTATRTRRQTDGATDRRFWLAVTLLLSFMASVMLYSAGLENATFDETEHMYSAYTLWRNGDYAYNVEHPPLSKLFAGVPLAPLDLWLPQRYIFRQTGQNFVDSQPFVYSNRVKPDVLLMRARLPLIFLTVMFGLVIALWTRRHFGILAAVLALFLFALDPNIIAHGRYVNTDLAAAAVLFFVVIAWDRFLRTRRTIDLCGAGVVLGLAFGSKFSLAVTPALLVILYGARWRRQREGLGFPHLVKSMTATLLIAGCVVGLIYFPDTVTLLRRNSDYLQNQIPPDSEIARGVKEFSERVRPIPGHRFLHGLAHVAIHNEEGHLAYLMGETSSRGRWQFFPIAIAVKTPTALLLAVIAAIVLLMRRKGGGSDAAKGDVTLDLLIIPPLFFLLPAMWADINIGLRHVLPLYPFVMVLAAVVLARSGWKPLIGLVVLLMVVEHAIIAPHYLAFFNLPSGGPWNGSRYLVDSSLDWGQDVKKLRVYLDREGVEEPCTFIFHRIMPAYYGLDSRDCIPLGPNEVAGQVFAVSATRRQFEPDRLAWLEEYEPAKRIGHSIFVYDFRETGR